MRRLRVTAFAILCLIAVPIGAMAQSGQDVESQVITQLRQQGFYDIEVERTLLGRLRFLSTNGALDREIVVNARSGEVLRDYWADRFENDGSGQRSGTEVVIADPTLPGSGSRTWADRGGGASGSSGSGGSAGSGGGAAADSGGPAAAY